MTLAVGSPAPAVPARGVREETRCIQIRLIARRTGTHGTTLHFIEIRKLTCLLGPNGAGKSSLLRLLAGEWLPGSGQVTFLGKALPDWDRRALARHRAVLPQRVRVAFPFTVEEVVRLGRSPYDGREHRRTTDQAVADALAAFELSALASRPYTRLSGGEQQRVHLARVFAQVDAQTGDLSEKTLLLDEPLNNLDMEHQYGLLALLRRLTDRGALILAVLHDLNLAFRFADQVVLLDQGRVEAHGAPYEVLTESLLSRVFRVGVRRGSWEGRDFLHFDPPPAGIC